VALNNIKTTDIDFDGDEIYLEDLWQLPVANIPKDTLKKLGYKIEFDEQGEARLIEREGGAQVRRVVTGVAGGRARCGGWQVEGVEDDRMWRV
jgi:hypothetical protein